MTVLLVDDEPDIRQMTKLSLEHDGRFKVVGEAGDGDEAIDMTLGLWPDLVLLDLSMPRMDGYAVMAAIEEAVPGTQVVVLTQHTLGLVETRVKALGGLAVLEKKFDITTLPHEIFRALNVEESAIRRRRD